MCVAVVHDWLTVYAGGERALEQILTNFPEADLFIVERFREQFSDVIQRMQKS